MASLSEQSSRTGRTFSQLFDDIVDNVELVVRGKRSAIELAVVTLLADGHLLVEDVPGVGKTSLAKALAASIDCTWKRAQFTPDLLPSDLVGVSVWSRQNETFVFQPGPLFANIVLADEINRASPKTQSALLEAMEERQVTIDGVTHRLPQPFLVIATQNPVEQDGTYRLPESQMDRFMIRMSIGYPDHDAEMEILDGTTGPVALEPVARAQEITAMMRAAGHVRMVEPLKAYLVDLAHASRRHPALRLGLSPRATVQLARATRALAASRGRDFATPDDVKELAEPTLAHRLSVRHDFAAQGITAADVIAEILASVPVPSGR